jgi:hypothetical protein
MGLAINLQQAVEVNMSVFLSCGQALMSKKLLNGSEVSPAAQKMRSERMAERMRADFPGNSYLFDPLLDKALDRANAQPSSAVIQEKGRSGLGFRGQKPSNSKIFPQPFFSLAAKRDNSFFLTLSLYPDQPFFNMKVFKIQ